MVVSNYSDVPTDQLAKLIDSKLDEKYKLITEDVYTAFPEKETTTMTIRRATPEETLAFYGKPLVIFGQKRPSSLKKNSNKQEKPQGFPSKTPSKEDQTLSQQANLDQERHNDWLNQQSPPELRKLAKNLSDLARSKLEKKKPSFTEEEDE